MDIYATDFPKQMSPIVTTNSGVNVVVTWVKPYDNSSPVTKFRIMFKNQNSQISEI
jgi:hypothetical protein